MTTNPYSTVDQSPINIRFKLSALWIAMMFMYVFADVLAVFEPGTVQGLLSGTLHGVQFTQEVLFGAAILVSIPSLMVFLCLILPARWNRRANIILGIVYALVNMANLLSFADPWAYIIFFNLAESAINLLIVWYAWRWTTREA
ncbi:MAG: DUF6326 family protein [Aggregatilineales bacterium]